MIQTISASHLTVLKDELFHFNRLLTLMAKKARMMELLAIELRQNLAGEKRFLTDQTVRSAVDMARKAIQTAVLATEDAFAHQRSPTVATGEAILMVQITLMHGHRFALLEISSTSLALLLDRGRFRCYQAGLDLVHTRVAVESLVFREEYLISKQRSALDTTKAVRETSNHRGSHRTYRFTIHDDSLADGTRQ